MVKNFDLNLTEEEKKLLGYRIQKARKERKFTQDDISGMINCSVGYLSAIENGHTIPGGKELVAFCKLFKKDMTYFFEGIVAATKKNVVENKESELYKLGIVSERDMNYLKKVLVLVEEAIDAELKKKKNVD